MAYVPLIALLLLAFFIYRFLISPILLSYIPSFIGREQVQSRIPNAHPTSGISSLWINWIRHQKREVRTIHAAFRKHGPVVRLAPEEIAINCVNGSEGGIQKVYGGGFEKHEWYSNLFDNYG